MAGTATSPLGDRRLEPPAIAMTSSRSPGATSRTSGWAPTARSATRRRLGRVRSLTTRGGRAPRGNGVAPRRALAPPRQRASDSRGFRGRRVMACG
jgi:hypothetical protein